MKVPLDKADYYELQTLMLREQLALQELVKASAATKLKLSALADAKSFDVDAQWTLDDATCSLVARG